MLKLAIYLISQIRLIIDKFGIAAVRAAWYDSKQVTEHILDGYTKVILLSISVLSHSFFFLFFMVVLCYVPR